MISVPFTPSSASLTSRLARTMWRNHIEMWQHFGRRWYVYAVLVLLGIAAAHYIGINFTDSMPERVVWLEHGVVPARGELIAFHFETSSGPATKFNGTRWLKRVKGMPGDRITVVGRTVYVNGELVGTAVERTPRGVELHPIAAGTVPPGHYFVGGTSLDSFDSRYSEIGFVRSDQVVARAHTIF